MRAVLDTNVVLSALLWRGAPYRVLEAARRQEQIGYIRNNTRPH